MLIVLAVGCQVIYNLPYLLQTIYALYQEATGYTNTQMGGLISIYGICAFGGYFISGLLADIFSIKKLMVISLFGVGGLGCVMALLPPYPVMLAIQVLFAVFSIGLYWTPLVKAISSLGDDSVQGKLFGFWESISGISALIVGFGGVAILGLFTDPLVSFRANVLLRAGLTILIGIITLIAYKEKKLPKEEKKKNYTAKEVFTVLRLPETWSLIFIILGVYFILSSLTYFAPYLMNFGADMMVSTVFGNLRSFYPIIGASIAGILVDKSKTSLKVIMPAMLMLAIAFLTLIIFPVDNKWLWVVAAICVLIGVVAYGAKGVYYVPIKEAKFPPHLYGVVVGIVATLGYTPDAFIYILAGRWIDSYQITGYHYIFIFMLVSALLSFISAFFLRKRIQKNQGAEIRVN